MTFEQVGKQVLASSLSLPPEAQCDPETGGCGFFNITHPEVKKKLADAGWSFDEAFAMAQCKCGTLLQKELKRKQVERAKQEAAKGATRSTFGVLHAQGIHDEEEGKRARGGFQNAVPRKDR